MKFLHFKHSRTAALILIVLTAFMGWECANVVAPSGGPRDVTPPKVKKCEPANFSPNLKEKRIVITLDEFFILEDQAGQIIISPPVGEEPDVNARGKKLVVVLPDSLGENTTYSIHFGEAIRDITESNALPGFRYVFSTGPVVDSLSIRGRVLDAQWLEPIKGTRVLLHSAGDDSLPLKQRPLYICRTDESGLFDFGNIAPGPYLVFALSDLNTNDVYDQPGEWIAFSDSLITPVFIPPPDTMAADSAKTDSIAFKPVKMINLFLYEQPDPAQKLLKARSDGYFRFRLFYRYPVQQLDLNPLPDAPFPEMLTEYSRRRDTITCWLMNPEIDSVKLLIRDGENPADTVVLEIQQKKQGEGNRRNTGKGNADQDPGSGLRITTNASSRITLPYFEQFRLRLSQPLLKFDSTKARLFIREDTTFRNIPCRWQIPGEGVVRVIGLGNILQEASTYRLLILPGAFTDIYGNKSDTLKTDFSTTRSSDYGNLELSLKTGEPSAQYLVQLFTESKVLLNQQISSGNGKVKFEHLAPGNYRIRIVHDRNVNGKWDPGDYLRHLQPEPVNFFPGLINVRANWDAEYELLL